MSTSYPWHAIVGRSRPATARDERLFFAALVTNAEILHSEEASGRIPIVRTASSFAKDLTLVSGTNVDRDIITLMMLSLRSAVTLPELLELAVATDSREMLAGYQLIETRRAAAEQAWYEALMDAADGVVSAAAQEASVMMPSAVRMLIDSPLQSLRMTAARLAEQTEVAHRLADACEQVLDNPPQGHQTPLPSMGRKLYDPYFGGLWHDPMFLPRRVGELSPPRLAALLGEGVR